MVTHFLRHRNEMVTRFECMCCLGKVCVCGVNDALMCSMLIIVYYDRKNRPTELTELTAQETHETPKLRQAYQTFLRKTSRRATRRVFVRKI